MHEPVISIPGYTLSLIEDSISYLKLILIKPSSKEDDDIIIELHNVIHYLNGAEGLILDRLRIDSGGTSYGLDFALRLNRDEIENYEVLYLFEVGNVGPVFKALAESIEVIDARIL